MTVSKLEKPDWRLFFDHLSKIPEIRKHPPETGPKTGLKTASTLSAVEPVPAAAMIALPWTAPSFAAVKGIIHEPSTKPTMKPESRDALLTAVAKARGWIDDIRLGRIASCRDCRTGGRGRTSHPPAKREKLPARDWGPSSSD